MGRIYLQILNGKIAPILCLMLLLPIAGSGRAAESPLWAGAITAANADSRIVGGPDGIGGIGDWALSNGELCAVVSDPSHDNEISATGGALIDLAHCDRDDDQFLAYQELLNLSPRYPLSGQAVIPFNGPRSASLLVKASYGGIASTTSYTLDLIEPRRIRITTRIWRQGDQPAVFAVAGVMSIIESLTPFTTSLGVGPGTGFKHREFSDGGLAAIAGAAINADLTVALGERKIGGGIAYGQQIVRAELTSEGGKKIDLPRFFLVNDMVSALAVLTKPLPEQPQDIQQTKPQTKPETMDLSPAATMNLRSGEIIHIEQYIWVGDRADVSAVTDLLLRHEPQLKGDLNQAGAIIHVNRADGTAVTQTSTGADGRFSLHLQAGEYRLRMVASGGLSREMAVSVETGGTDLGSLSIGAVAEIQLPRNYPMRLVFKGEKGTLDPNFADDLLGFQLTRGDRVQHRRSSPDVNLAGIAADPQSIPLPPGNYRVYATRGPEFGVTEAVIEVHEAGRYVLEISPPLRVLETPGWISADLHVHAEASFDTNFPVRERLRSFVAQGGEVLVSTEHDVIYDFSTDITQLGVGHLMRSIVGVEITSEVMSEAAPYTIGHGNAFPMKRIEHAFRKGAPISENRRWRDLIAELRALDTDPVLQLNHARYGASEDSAANPQAFFTHLGSSGRSFDPNIPLSEGVNRILNEKDPTNGLRDIDFSALELLNGNNMAAYRQLRSDWFSLLKQGERLTATANSDSHGAGSIVAAPRTMVRFDGELKDFRETDFIKAIKGGRVYATTGPLLDVTLGDAEIGGMVTGEQAVLKVAVKAASWVPVSTLKVYVNGQVAVQRDIRNGESLALPLSFSRDSFVTVEVEGNPSPLYTTLLPGFVPLAFTNPIYIDADGDGTWTAPMQ